VLSGSCSTKHRGRSGPFRSSSAKPQPRSGRLGQPERRKIPPADHWQSAQLPTVRSCSQRSPDCPQRVGQSRARSRLLLTQLCKLPQKEVSKSPTAIASAIAWIYALDSRSSVPVLAKSGQIGQHLSAGKDGSRTRALSDRCSRLAMSRRHGEAGAAWLQQRVFVRRLPTASPSSTTEWGEGSTRR